MTKPRVAAVIQARMGSTRLPGKVLMPLAGKPVLWHIIHRLRKCRTVDVIAIATSDRPGDDALVAFAKSEGVELVRGAEDDVLQRYAKAGEELDAGVIVRVTGDSPLLDPETLDRMVETLLLEGAEYCTAQAGVHSIHEGFCTFTREALRRLLAEASDDPAAIEHVTAYFVAHPDKFRIARIPIGVEHRFEGARLSVDTPADLRFFHELYRLLGVAAGEADMARVVRLLRDRPDLVAINGHVYQKKATDRSRKVLIRCDGDGRTGLGHVVRCLALAGELRDRHGCGVLFAMASGEPGWELVRQAGFPCERQDRPGEAAWIDAVMLRQRPDVMVLDLRNDLDPEQVASWRKSGLLMVVLDDPGPRRREADLSFFPPVPQIAEWDWSGFAGELCRGWEWVLLRPEFADAPAPPGNSPPRVLVTMGGSDPANFTLRALRALDDMPQKFETLVVVGPGFVHEAELGDFLAAARRLYRIERQVRDKASLMRGADLAVASFGVTAYELAATGVPAVHLCLSDDHARSASRFTEDGLALCCGVGEECSEARISRAVAELLAAPERREEMSRRARALLDGRGAARTAAKIMDAINGRESSHA